jgi:hypothetical protein
MLFQILILKFDEAIAVIMTFSKISLISVYLGSIIQKQHFQREKSELN